MKELQQLDVRLSSALKTLDVQMSKLGRSDQATFHKALMALMSDHSEQKEIIQFIVAINDKLETKNSHFRDLVYDTLKEIIETKRALMDKLIKDLEARKTTSSDLSLTKEMLEQLLKPKKKSLPSFGKVYALITSSKLLFITVITVCVSIVLVLAGPTLLTVMNILLGVPK